MGKECKSIQSVVTRNINHLIIEKDMTRCKLAEKTKISYNNFLRKMHGDVDWKLGDLDIIAKCLKVTVKDLVDRNFIY